MVEDKNLRAELLDLFRKSIRSGNVINITLDRDTDADGDAIVKVYVVFENKTKRIDAKETIGASRSAREKLVRMGEESSPVFYYVAKSEAGKLAEAG